MGCNFEEENVYHPSAESLDDDEVEAPLNLDPPYMVTHLQDPDILLPEPWRGAKSALENHS